MLVHASIEAFCISFCNNVGTKMHSRSEDRMLELLDGQQKTRFKIREIRRKKSCRC